MANNKGTNETFYSNYPTAPDGVVRSDAPVKKHPLVTGSAGNPAKTAVDVGGSDVNSDGVGTRSDKKIT